ncbi:DUF3991 and toprim domain-containing protein [[Ruminococcus] torques]|uniref:DUF3991 and toprim domain-containing protein n=1 Tax=[Ruminococcus] torques TaxID=33039 RepID=UPI00242FD914|nr:DUF3991 and toprim domain-containing protein [[Ruminococcus] torques]
MSKYIHFTEEQKAQARRTDIVSLLKSQGETVKRSGSEYEWKDGSQKVTIRGNLWFHQYDRVGGDAIDFVRRFYNKSYTETMEFLLGDCGGVLIISPPVVKEKKPFELPKPYRNMDRVKNYLHYIRGIDEDIIETFANENMIYESADYHNAVFVGYDRNGVPRHAHKRGTGQTSTFKGNVDSCIPEYSFHWNGTSNKIYLFEAPIDMLSFISMHKENWKNHSYAASCSVSDRVLFQCLKDYPYIEKVYLCLDSDEPGQTAADRISTKLFALGIESEILVPIHKDWNEDLLLPNEKMKESENQCPVLQL